MRLVIVHILLVTSSLCLAGRPDPHSSKEMGVNIGLSYYLGDLNQTHFIPLNSCLGGYFRYNLDDRVGVRVNFNYGKIEGNDAASTNQFESTRNFSFHSKIYEFAVLGEFNFLDFSPLSARNNRFSPYGFLGLGFFHHRPKQQGSGIDIDLLTEQTEGVTYKLFQFSIPMGIGLKYRKGRIGYSFEWGIRKTFTDYLDDVSSHYAVSNTGGRDNPFDFLNYQRGEVYTNDWYVFTGLGIFVNLAPVRQPNSCIIN